MNTNQTVKKSRMNMFKNAFAIGGGIITAQAVFIVLGLAFLMLGIRVHQTHQMLGIFLMILGVAFAGGLGFAQLLENVTNL